MRDNVCRKRIEGIAAAVYSRVEARFVASKLSSSSSLLPLGELLRRRLRPHANRTPTNRDPGRNRDRFCAKPRTRGATNLCIARLQTITAANVCCAQKTCRSLAYARAQTFAFFHRLKIFNHLANARRRCVVAEINVIIDENRDRIIFGPSTNSNFMVCQKHLYA